MITITPATTPESLAVQQLAAIVAGNADFQSACGIYSKDAAKAFVFDGGDLVNGSTPKCSSIIYDITGEAPMVLADGVVMPAGQLILDIWLSVENGDDMRGEYLRINNLYGSIGQSVNSYIGPGYQMRATKSGAPQRSNPAHVAEAKPDSEQWFVQYSVSWDCFGK